jgi:hypothetical protein
MRQDAPLDAERDGPLPEWRVEDAPPPYRYGAAASPSPARRAFAWLIGALVVAAAVGAGYYYWTQRAPAPPAADPPPPSAAAEAAREAVPEPAIRHPIEAARPDAPLDAAAPLPALDASDRSVEDALAAVAAREAIAELLNTTGFIRRIVATVDNLPRKKAPQRLWPAVGCAGRFATTGAGDAVQLGPQNYRRYEPFVRFVESVDAGKAAAIYVRFYPLFQQAYRELGYPKGYFNDRLVEVIDHLLVTPELDGPIRLARPWILYEFADPALEARSAGQKALIRMGAANQVRVKAKLREFRRQVAGQALKE